MANFYCEHCGQKYTSVSSLTNGSCSKHPDGHHKGRHKLYERSEKSQYLCKYCSLKYSTLTSLTNGSCSKHPEGHHKGTHSPAL